MATPILALIPSGYKSEKVYSVLPSNGDGDFTFTREGASGQPNSTRVNKDGLIEEVNSNVPRLDYSDGSCPSLLLEPSSTNLITYSEDFSQWESSNVSVLDNFTVSPSGTQNASKFTFNGTTNGRVEKNISVVNGTQYTFSVWLKNDDLADPTQVWIGLSTSNQGEYVTVTNEWKRFTTTQVSNGTTEYPRIQTSEVGSIFAWGAQLENQSYSTSYIATQGSVATRVAETCTDAGNADTFNSTEGVLYAEVSYLDTNDAGYIQISDGTSNNRIIIWNLTSTSLRGLVVVGGVAQAQINGGVISNNTTFKVALKYKVNDFALWVNGVEIGTDVLGLTFGSNVLNKINLSVNSVEFKGKIKDVRVYDTALTDAELEALTS